jgi:hypothetical protein
LQILSLIDSDDFSSQRRFSMIWIVLLVLSMLLFFIGIKGFTPSGLQFSKDSVLTGRDAKIVGVVCIAFGIGLIPMFMFVFRKFLS